MRTLGERSSHWKRYWPWALARAQAVGSPVMEVHRLALTFGDKPVEYRVSTINTQAHDYVSVLSKKS